MNDRSKAGGPKRGRGRVWRTIGFVVSPLVAAGLWGRFVDAESMVAMLVGVGLTVVFGVVAGVCFLRRGGKEGL